MPDQHYLVLDLAHSLHGRLRRIHLSRRVVRTALGLSLLGCCGLFGFASSYLRMSWKVSNYNELRSEMDVLRERYKALERESHDAQQQLASFQLLASEVSAVYGIKRDIEGPDGIAAEGRLVPTVAESLADYNFLKTARLATLERTGGTSLWSDAEMPEAWPVQAPLSSYFGKRTDPFSGEGAFHTGIDFSAPSGTSVKATAGGVVTHAEYSGRYGNLVVVDHGDGVETYYAHLSGFDVVEGQRLQRGDVVGLSGCTGRSTAPHLHYEVRVNGTPVNPYQYLQRAGNAAPASSKRPYLF